MKVCNIKDIDAFFKTIDECKGRVQLLTKEGDIINLKSKLSQYVAFAEIFAGDVIPEIEIVAHDAGDSAKLLDFMMNS